MADSRTVYAEALSLSGNHHKAVDLLEDAITALEDAFDMEHYRVIEGKVTLADVYMRLRRYQEAGELREQILNDRLKHYGSKNKRTLISRYNLAITYEALGRMQDETRILTEAVNTARDTYGHDDPGTIRYAEVFIKPSLQDIPRMHRDGGVFFGGKSRFNLWQLAVH